MSKLIYLHGQQEDPTVEHIDFPTGEKHIRIQGFHTPTDDIVIYYNDPSGEIVKLALAVDICRRKAPLAPITLVMPFVPYARQDRVAEDGDPFSIKVFAELINSMGFSRVLIADPHSEVTPAVLNNAVVIPQHEIAAKVVADLTTKVSANAPIALVAPDLGASKKTKALQKHLFDISGYHYPIIQCDKTRNTATGQISGFKVLDGMVKGYHCLLVDDICDGGGTFLGLGRVLNGELASALSLFVTHGIFSKGVTELSQMFDWIYATDSFPSLRGVTTVPCIGATV